MNRPSPRPSRWLHLWFDRLSTDRILRARPPLTAPFGLIVRQGSAIRLAAVDAAASALGLAPGLTLAAARARVPELQVEDADPAADAAFLRKLAEACRRYTPSIALHPPDALDLEISGSAHLFDGELELVEAVRRRFTGFGLSMHIGAASNPAAAFAFARFGTPEEPGTETQKIARLPVHALDLPTEELRVLIGLGVRQIEKLDSLSRASLGLRFEPETLERLDQLLGRRTRALPLIEEVSPFMAEARLAEPICDEVQVMAFCLALARQLVEALQIKGQGGRQFVLELFRVDGAIKRLEVRASRALADPSRIADLFAERLAALNEGLEVDFGFDAARLWAGQTRKMRPETIRLIGRTNRNDQLIAVLDRAAARFGSKIAHRFAPDLRSHLPEAAVKPAFLAKKGSLAWTEQNQTFESAPLRPLTLFAPPQPISATAGVPEDPPRRFIWRRVERQISRAEGPERISDEWWRSPEPEIEPGSGLQSSELDAPVLIRLPQTTLPVRDYYRLEDTEGRRYWVFREGRYGGGETPRWFLHGLFA